MNLTLYYKKNKNENLFKNLENSLFKLSNLQNYIPIYENFFSLNESNYNNINLNQKFHFNNVNSFLDKNNVIAEVLDISNNTFIKNVFCKFSPLLDPLKFLSGKYNFDICDLSKIPQLNNNTCIPKLLDSNNSSYVDSFFTYLSSQLLNNYKFINCLDYYGSYLANQEEFIYNIADDIDYLNECEYFHKNKNILYNIESKLYSNIFDEYTRKNKSRLNIKHDSVSIDIDIDNLNTDLNYTDNTNNISSNCLDLSNSCIFSYNIKSKSNKSSTSSSSKTCSTDCSDDESNNDDSKSDTSSDESDEEDNTSSCYDEEDIYCNIYNFPVQLISMEKCENTLDYLMENDLLSDKEWVSCLFQIIITLSLFQKTFSFTHNDLHTNNIMYIITEKKYLYYCFENIYYKVPTFGKIYKIIDFGRSIYKFNGKIMCSDSFHPKGDAASQYNCEPYFNETKPRLEPNPSFDLCRLSCCLFDNFVEDIDDLKKILKENKIFALVYSWLVDDKGRNILYKTNGEERYLDFKLYKMIARTIHNAVPYKQLKNNIFNNYIINKNKIKNGISIMNIDKIPNFQ